MQPTTATALAFYNSVRQDSKRTVAIYARNDEDGSIGDGK